MMTYVALLTGTGPGCDYTIGCGKQFVEFDAADDSAALETCRELWEYNGGSDRVKKIQLYSVARTIPVPSIHELEARMKKEAESREAERELQKIEARAAELRSKLGK